MVEEGSKGLVLVVDDEPVNRALLKAIIQREGYQVAECANGFECLEFCRDTKPEMVLLDIMMPRMDGIEACTKLREQYPADELPILMVTTRSESDALTESMEAGANDYITKPVNRKSFVARFNNQLALKNYHLQIQEQQRSLERSLELQKAMGDLLPDGIALVDSEGRVTYSNVMLAELCDEIEPENRNELFASVFHGCIIEQLYKIQSTVEELPSQSFNEEIELASPTQLNIRILSTPVTDVTGQTQRLWLFRDLTHLRELERRISQRVKLETVSIFASGVAHNFNNFMGGILGATESLERHLAEDVKAARRLALIKQAVEGGKTLTGKMAGLVRRELTEATRGGSELRESIQAVAREVLPDSVSLQFDFPEFLPAVAIDPGNLEEILTNILNNSCDAMRGGGTITISANIGIESDTLHVVFADDGAGMSKDVLDKVFEPFFSTKNLDERNGVSMVGNGLGLWNTYNLLTMIGGEIWIESQQGQGTSVHIIVPSAVVCDYRPAIEPAELS